MQGNLSAGDEWRPITIIRVVSLSEAERIWNLCHALSAEGFLDINSDTMLQSQWMIEAVQDPIPYGATRVQDQLESLRGAAYRYYFGSGMTVD